MSITLKNQTKETIQNMKDHYSANLKDKTPQHAAFSASINGVTITAYHSGSVMFQGKDDVVAEQVALWSDTSIESTTPKTTDLPDNFGNLSVIGSDEVGNGSYFGPVVCCAAFVPADQIQALKDLGVKDSKMLTDIKIREIAKEIEPIVQHAMIDLYPERYNELQQDKGLNAVSIKVYGHQAATSAVARHLSEVNAAYDYVLIDKFTSEKSYVNYLKSWNCVDKMPARTVFHTEGEQHHIACAAASIIARARFLDELDELSEQAGVTLPSGAGDASDEIAANIISSGGTELLAKFAKMHFKNTEKALKILEER